MQCYRSQVKRKFLTVFTLSRNISNNFVFVEFACDQYLEASANTLDTTTPEFLENIQHAIPRAWGRLLPCRSIAARAWLHKRR